MLVRGCITMEGTMMTWLNRSWVLSVAVLCSCATTAVDEGSPYYRLPVGTNVVLQQELAVQAGHTRVFLQQGKVVAKNRLDIYRPHCDFEQHAVSDGTAVIKADRFRVTAVSSGEDLVVQSDPLIHAGWNLVGEFDGVTLVNRYVQHTLSSPGQPQVMRLTCHGGFAFPGQALTPSLTEMRAALGEVVAIER